VVRHGREQHRPRRHAQGRFLTDRRAAPAHAGAASWRLVVGVAALASALVTAAARPGRAPYPDGAPPGFSGGFGEDSCTACHFDHDLNELRGGVSLSGVPAAYTPGASYSVTIALRRPGTARAGFQLTARFEDGTQAGTLAAPEGAEDRIAVTAEAATRVQYASQREAGSRPSGEGAARWSVRWTAPAAGSPAVLFHVAANAADGDGSASGDYVYTTAAASQPD
jgi:hypothetical protein